MMRNRHPLLPALLLALVTLYTAACARYVPPHLQGQGGTSPYASIPLEPGDGQLPPAPPFPIATPKASNPGAIHIDDLARFLAGMPARQRGDGLLYGWRSRTSWRAYQQRMDALWLGYLQERGDAIASWRRREIPDLAAQPTVFYPFSGPDFLYANAFFPDARNYVLVGLEKPEPLPALADLTDIEIAFALDGIHDSLVGIFGYSFFVTKEMRTQFASTRFPGTLPPILVFLARTGHVIDEVVPIALDKDGTPGRREGAWSKHRAAGYTIVCRTKRGVPRQVTYLRADLSDSTLAKDKRLLRYASSMGTPVTLLKSASYLMHGGGFDHIRNHILGASSAILQDASGIPYRHIAPATWDTRLYGDYSKILDMFQEHYQPDLRAAYVQGPTHPVRFGIGYEYDAPVTAIILSRRR